MAPWFACQVIAEDGADGPTVVGTVLSIVTLNAASVKLDVTMPSLQQGGLAIIGMSVKALAWGAADGMAQLGDPKSYPALVKSIEDTMGNIPADERDRMIGRNAVRIFNLDD